MLTADLLRARVRSGVVRPQYIKLTEEIVARVGELVQTYGSSVGRPAGDIAAEIDALVGDGTDFMLWRGLRKLVEDRCEFTSSSQLDSTEVRRLAFERAFAGDYVDSQRRAEVIDEVAQNLETSSADVEAALYADLADRQTLIRFDALTAEELLHRYNLSLAQAVLYKAASLTITVTEPPPDKLRYLMGALKFHGLMHRVVRDEHGSVSVTIDGPTSVLKNTRRYGIKMAMFLPALMLLPQWDASARVDWKGKEREFHLDPSVGLVSHYKARGGWRTDEEKWFEEKFATQETDWQLVRRGTIVELADGEVIVGDYVLTSPDGAEVVVEIVTFWRAAYLRRRLDLLDTVTQPFVLIVSERMRAERGKLEALEHPELVFYKGVIIPKKVIAAAEAALRPGS